MRLPNCSTAPLTSMFFNRINNTSEFYDFLQNLSRAEFSKKGHKIQFYISRVFPKTPYFPHPSNPHSLVEAPRQIKAI
jgi:hypothetical protein